MTSTRKATLCTLEPNVRRLSGEPLGPRPLCRAVDIVTRCPTRGHDPMVKSSHSNVRIGEGLRRYLEPTACWYHIYT